MDLNDALEAHKKWINDKVGGACANLSGADLSNADLSSANLSSANLSGANLSDADLSSADLSDANLSSANLSGANLSGANLSGANLSDADLIYANLIYANLRGANLSDANLLAYGDMIHLRTMQFGRWAIGYTHDTLQIGCQRHRIDKWKKWDTEAGRQWVAQMDTNAREWAEHNLKLVLQIIDANPADHPNK
jgi:uncharacterized protein YjbI with pentapeptide repeats